MTLGTRIAAMRGYRRLNQEALGGMVGVTKQTVSGWENDRRKPDAEDIRNLCRALGCTADDWLTSDGIGGYAPRSRIRSSWESLRGVIEPWHPLKNGRNSWQTYMRWTLGVEPYYIEPLMGHVGEGVTGRHYDRPGVDEFASVVAAAYAANQFDAGWTWAD